MTDQPVGALPKLPKPRVTERRMSGAPGLLMLLVCLVLMAGGAVAAVTAPAAGVAAIGLLVGIIGLFSLRGLTIVAPGQARVVQLLGRYRGTLRKPGMTWVNPFTTRRTVSTRIRNQESSLIKVNDADGNPIEIAAVVVWQVEDTAQAVFEVDDYRKFVAIQCETAVRHIANSFPYDARESGARSLRDSGEEITALLVREIAARVAAAGVTIVESRITRLSYAPEIAQVMLQRQQAGAVVAARRRIVEGAVGMVEMALAKLSEQDIVELDEERKAAMVSNLLVVLCGDRGTQPVVNTGSLYQ